jgi:hypothetical protein
VQRVPNVCKTSSRTSTWPNLHRSCLTVRMLEARSSRTTQEGQRRIWVHFHCNRQIHQMDRIQAARKVQRSKSSWVHLKHHAPLWNTQSRHHRFGFPFYSHRIQKLGLGLRHQYRLCISCKPWSQRTSGKSQRTHTSWVETKIVWRTRRLWLQVDWRIAQNSLGATHSSKQSNRVLAFLPSPWVRSRATSRLDLDIPKIKQYEEEQAEHTRRLEIDSTEEIRVNATIQSAQYLQGLRRHYNKSTQSRSVQVGDLVL